MREVNCALLSRLVVVQALFWLGACHDGLHSDPEISPSHDVVHSDPELCATLRSATPSACPEPYQAIDASQAASICNDGNEVTSTLTSTCSASATTTGTWVPEKVAAQSFSANFVCPGASSGGNNVWSCKTATATVQFVDGTALVFTGSGDDGPIALSSCSPARFFARLSEPSGWHAMFSIEVPDFGQGSFPVAVAGATSQNAKAVPINLHLAPPDANGFGLDTFAGGNVTFVDASVDPTFALSFTIDADLAVPTGDVPEEYAIFCGNANEVHSGLWMNFRPK